MRFILLFLFTPLLAWCSPTPMEVKAAAKAGFEQRWQNFQDGTRAFLPWSANWKEEELKKQYSELCQEREKLSKQRGMHVRFSSNEACLKYDASIVALGGKLFLAMRAPTSGNQKEFFDLLSRYGVTDLVRLTALWDGGIEMTAPYWEGKININPKTGKPTVAIDGREMNYIMTDLWLDQQGIEPDRLLALVKAAMANTDPNQVIAVHCHAGAGRTGTFLAAYRLIQEIDEQLAGGVSPDRVHVSVDKAIWEVCLQRPAVGAFDQYLSLYRLVGTYLDQHD